MSGSIYRLSIPVTDYQEIEAGLVLSAAADRSGASDVLDLWFETSPMELTAIRIFGTGHPTPWNSYTRHAYQFVDTVVTPSGLVWHVYTGPLKGQAIAV